MSSKDTGGERIAFIDTKRPGLVHRAIDAEQRFDATLPGGVANLTDGAARAKNAVPKLNDELDGLRQEAHKLRNGQLEREVQAATLAYSKPGTDFVPWSDIPDTRREYADLEAQIADLERLISVTNKASNALMLAAQREIVEDGAYQESLRKAYVKATAYKPKASDTWATIQVRQEEGRTAQSVIGSLWLDIEAAKGGATPDELKRLRKAIKNGEDLYTIAEMRERQKEIEAASPLAKVQREQEERKAAQKKQAQADSQANAKIRHEVMHGGTPS